MFIKQKDGNLISVINVMCRLFMDNIDDPFRKLDDVIEQIKIENGEHTILLTCMENQHLRRWQLDII